MSQEKIAMRQLSARTAVGELPAVNLRHITKETRGLAALLEARFGFQPSPFRKRLKTQAGAGAIAILTVAILLTPFSLYGASPALLPAGGQKTLAGHPVTREAGCPQTVRATPSKSVAAGNPGNGRSILSQGGAVVARKAHNLQVAGSIPALATNLSPEWVAALYGETCGEPYACKLLTAQAMLNRGKLRGVCGKDSKLLRQPINARAWADCVRALTEARQQPDHTKGAAFWACKQDLGKPYLRGLVCTARAGGHWFYAAPKKTGGAV